jgi:hypothetical protein
MRQNAGLLNQHVSSISMPIFRSTLLHRFGHQKAVLTNVLLKMGILMLKTC